MIACTSRNRCALFIWALACYNLFVNSDKIRGFRKNKNKPVKVRFNGKLREPQKEAVKAMMAHDNGEDDDDGQLNAIYDIETYAETFWHDIELAKYSVVISSPRLNADKVSRLIKTIGKCQENGTKCTIVTWHPDVYGLEKSEARMALLERLRKAGFEIYYLEETCEHFAVIDQNVVWYGSMELLAKPDVEDNLMRVRSGKIAAELLELTFGEAKNLQKW